jgi:ribosome-associated heat shock protein Hsp15
MRVDRFLFFIRLAKSRTLAQAVVDEGRVRIDGKRVQKSSEEVRVGSVIALPLRGEVRILRVLTLPARRGPAAEARGCYEELTEANPRPSEGSKGSRIP